MKKIVILISVLLMCSQANATEAPDKKVDAWAAEIVKVHNSSSTYAELFTKSKLVAKYQEMALSKSLKKKLPTVSYITRTNTFEYSNGLSLQVVSIERGEYKVNGSTYRFPKDFQKLSKVKRKAAWLNIKNFDLISAAHAEPPYRQGCKLSKESDYINSEWVGDYEGIGSFLFQTYVVGVKDLVAFPVVSLTNRLHAYVAPSSPSCIQQVNSMVQMIREKNIPLSGISCDEDYAHKSTINFKEGDASYSLLNNAYRGHSYLTTSGGKADKSSKWVFHHSPFFGLAHKGEEKIKYNRINTLEGNKKNDSRYAVYKCSDKSPQFVEARANLRRFQPLAVYLHEKGFCYKCNKSRHLAAIVEGAKASVVEEAESSGVTQ